MSAQRQFGLIGKSLQHSFSKTYFEKKFAQEGLQNCSYANYELQNIEAFKPLVLNTTNLEGVNVTIPYKESILPLLDELDQEASEIGAVNCVRIRNGKSKGYNTDAYGFAQSIKPFLENTHERALILGTGGASRAVAFALKKIGVETAFVSSDSGKKKPGVYLYTEINERMMEAFKLIVNTTPLGTYPNTESCPSLPYRDFTSLHLAYDLVYNPAETLFLKKARSFGAIGMNGLSMLQLQAEKSWEIWNRD
jgi:shikimate dehydrogenase